MAHRIICPYIGQERLEAEQANDKAKLEKAKELRYRLNGRRH